MAHSIVSQLDMLEGKRQVGSQFARQFIFQSGRKTFYCIPQAMSCATPKDFQDWFSTASGWDVTDEPMNPGGVDADTVTTGKDFYMWGNETSIHIQNHSLLPLYLKVHYIRPRKLIPVTVKITGAPGSQTTTTDAIPDLGTPDDKSHIISAIVVGLKQHYDISSPNQLIATMSDGGFYGGTTGDGVNRDIGEGFGTSGNKALEFGQVNGAVEYGCACPLGTSLYDSSTFCEQYDVYHTKSFILGDECQAHLELSDKKLKLAEFENTNFSFYDSKQLQPWSNDQVLANKDSTYIILEMQGSLVGVDPWDGIEGITEAHDDDYDIGPNLSKVTTHGGIVRMICIKEAHIGAFTNQAQEKLINKSRFFVGAAEYDIDPMHTDGAVNETHVDP